MKALKSHKEEISLDFDIPEKVQTLIDNLKINSDWKSKIIWTKQFEFLDNFLRIHPLYSNFYLWSKLVDKEVKEELTVLKKINKLGFLKWIMTQTESELGEHEFDEKQIANLINFKHNTVWFFVDDFINKSLENNSLHSFITILLLCQLKSQPISVTDFINNNYLTQKLVIHTYEGFEDCSYVLNGISENSSTGQNIRLAAIISYNYYVKQLWLSWLIEPVKYIHSSKIELHKRVINWKEMDDVMSSHYVIDKIEIKNIINESFNNVRDSAQLIETLWRLNVAPWMAGYYLIRQYDFNNIFDLFGDTFKAKILGYFNSKTAKQMFQDKIKQIMLDAKQWKFMTSNHTSIVNYWNK